MQSYRLRPAIAICAVALILGAVACEPSSGDDASTSGGDSGGVVQPDNSPDPLSIVVDGGNCFGKENGTVTVKISLIRPGGGYSVKTLYPVEAHKNGAIATSSGSADANGKATWSFSCGKLPKGPNYRIEATDMNTGSKGTSTFDVLR